MSDVVCGIVCVDSTIHVLYTVVMQYIVSADFSFLFCENEYHPLKSYVAYYGPGT